jgi:hypothetical protein
VSSRQLRINNYLQSTFCHYYLCDKILLDNYDEKLYSIKMKFLPNAVLIQIKEIFSICTSLLKDLKRYYTFVLRLVSRVIYHRYKHLLVTRGRRRLRIVEADCGKRRRKYREGRKRKVREEGAQYHSDKSIGSWSANTLQPVHVFLAYSLGVTRKGRHLEDFLAPARVILYCFNKHGTGPVLLAK